MEVIAFVIIAGILGWIGYSAFNKEKNGKHPLDSLGNNQPTQPVPTPEVKKEEQTVEVKSEPVVVEAAPVVVTTISEPVAEAPKVKRGRKKTETTSTIKEKPAKKPVAKTKKATSTTAKKVKKV